MYMMRDYKLRFLALALAGFATAACGDNGTEPGVDFDAAAVSQDVDAALAPMEASNDASFGLSSFAAAMLGGGSEFSRQAFISRVPDTRFQAMVRKVAVDAEVEIPAEMLGNTFVYNPTEAVWEVDETRTGAPADGVRVIWYATDGASYALPLVEMGYIDLTDEDNATMERVGVVIVRTDGGTITLADFVHGYGATETETSWTEALEFAGYFTDGTQQVNVDIALAAEGTNGGDEAYAWDLFFEGAEASYRWALDGSANATDGTYSDDLVVTIHKDGLNTILDLQITGDEVDQTETGAGTLSHGGVLVANVTAVEGEYSFSKPDGGSFTTQEQNQLQGLMVTMILYGPLLLLSMPLLFTV